MSWLTNGGSKQQCCYFQRRRERFFLFLSPLFFVLSFSVSFTSGCLFVLSALLFNKISLPGFKLPLNLSFLSLLRYSPFGHFLSSLRFVPFSLFLCYFSLPLPLPLLRFLSLLFRLDMAFQNPNASGVSVIFFLTLTVPFPLFLPVPLGMFSRFSFPSFFGMFPPLLSSVPSLFFSVFSFPFFPVLLSFVCWR